MEGDLIRLRIAICDDEELVCLKLEQVILEYGEINKWQMEVELFYDGQDLLSQIEQGESFNLIFLDIDMRHVNGIEVGKVIREKRKDEQTQIVYISGMEQYAMDLFQVRPLHFLIKPISKEKVIWAINKTLELMGSEEGLFECRCNKNLLRIPVKDILYFMSDSRKIRVITGHGIKEFYGKLSDVEGQINSNFIRVHKSYIVNSRYITDYAYERVQLSDGNIFNITRKYRAGIRDRLMKGGMLE